MFDADWLKEFRLLVADLGLGPYQTLALLVALMITLRIGTVLKHRREMAEIKADSALENAKLQAKIKRQTSKREHKRLKSKKKGGSDND
ncbi:hypothetical protein [Yoonia sp. BS5-3]|uniref:Uncharacterized protein n=1 Tax=Yoonia phaeophyticola TaxID=3137369 RepID=A0ABZ2V1Z3_9RHOB